MQTIIENENNIVKSIKIECSAVEYLLLKTGIELLADNPNLNIKDRRIAKNMVKDINGKDEECED